MQQGVLELFKPFPGFGNFSLKHILTNQVHFQIPWVSKLFPRLLCFLYTTWEMYELFQTHF